MLETLSLTLYNRKSGTLLKLSANSSSRNRVVAEVLIYDEVDEREKRTISVAFDRGSTGTTEWNSNFGQVCQHLLRKDDVFTNRIEVRAAISRFFLD